MVDETDARRILRAAGVDHEGPLRPCHGWSNAAWVGLDCVVRVSSGRLRGSLAHEAVVLAGLGEDDVHIAVPVVVGVGEGPVAGGEWLVTTTLPGVTLAEAWSGLDGTARRRVGAELGRALRTLHEEADLVAEAQWWRDAQEAPQLHNAYHPMVRMGPVMVAAARLLPSVDDVVLDEVEAFIDERLPLFEEDIDAFVHSDIHGHNLLVDPATGALTGVLDWEGSHRAAPDEELDMLLRWVQAAHNFPARPGDPCEIEKGDVLELVDHIGSAYPELLSGPRLRERLELYEALWQLVQLHFDCWWVGQGHGDAAAPPASWARLRMLLNGQSHVHTFRL
jgi:aminoglycoside phosphotransferase (APT) family kinase protein